MKIVNENKIKVDQWYRMQFRKFVAAGKPGNHLQEHFKCFYVKTIIHKNELCVRGEYYCKDKDDRVYKMDMGSPSTIKRLIEWDYIFYPMKEKDVFVEVI